MNGIFSAMAPLFFLIFLGFFLRKTEIANQNWEGVLADFAIKVGLPALLFLSIAEIDFRFSDEFPLLIANSGFLFFVFFAVFIVSRIFRLSPKMFRTTLFATAFGNVAFLGIPILTRISDAPDISPTASLLVAIYLFWIFTVGVFLVELSLAHEKKSGFFSRKKILLHEVVARIFLNPLLVSIFLGVLFALSPYSLSPFFRETLGLLRDSVTPVVLVAIGLFLADVHGKSRMEWLYPFVFSVCTLVILPAIFVAVILLLGLSTTQFLPSLLDAAMPLAITPFALAEKYEFDKNFLARAILVSTLLSGISLPAWIFFLS